MFKVIAAGRRRAKLGALLGIVVGTLICATACDAVTGIYPSSRPVATPTSDDAPASVPGTPTTPGAPNAGAPLLLMAMTTDRIVLEAARELNAIRCYIIYQGSGETRGKYDEAKLRREIERLIPATWGGPVCLDFEGTWLSWITEDPESPEFRRGEGAMLELLRVAREVRPRAKWSFYGIPTMRPFVANERNRTVGWDQGTEASKERAFERGRRVRRVVEACDWVAPTIYDPYEWGRLPRQEPAKKAHVEAMVRLAKELAGDRPVYPFVWHRVHESNRDDGLQLLSDRQFIEGQIAPALQAGADGVVWWGADRLMIRRGQVGKRQPDELEGVDADDAAAVDAYLRRINLQRLETLRPFFPRP